MGIIDKVLDWWRGSPDPGIEVGGSSDKRHELWQCPHCFQIHSAPFCPVHRRPINQRERYTGDPKNPVVDAPTFSIQPWAIGTVLVLGTIAVIVAASGWGGVLAPAVVVVGAGSTAGSVSAGTGPQPPARQPPGALQGPVSGSLPGGTTTPAAPPLGPRTASATPGTATSTAAKAIEPLVWKRIGPIFGTGDERRKPKYLQVTDSSLTYTAERDGRTWTNTLSWSTPPATLKPGDSVTLTMMASSQQGWANVSGWWNFNVAKDGKGETGVGSAKSWRAKDPHSSAFTFIFAPGSAKPYMQVSAGHDPVKDQWVLVTWEYERQGSR